MKSTSSMLRLALVLATSACVTSPPDSTMESEAEAALTGNCFVHPHCSGGGVPSGAPATPLEAQLGCSGRAGYSSGLGDTGAGSFCPDTPQARQLGMGVFLHAGYCDECITVPAGQIFVYFFRVQQPPLCPSGCGRPQT